MNISITTNALRYELIYEKLPLLNRFLYHFTFNY